MPKKFPKKRAFTVMPSDSLLEEEIWKAEFDIFDSGSWLILIN